jgi:hypothetical protein
MAKSESKVKEGDVFGRLTVIAPRAAVIQKAYHHLCRCECGTEKLIMTSNLTLGKSKSCGCLAREVTGRRAATHGMSKTTEYQTWNRMWSRCTNPVVDRYPQYGGRGISVCEEWRVFENFYRDLGPKPSAKHSLGRIDNNGNYCPSNCRWETPEEQHSNTSTNVFIEYDGLRLTIAQWGRRLGISEYTIGQRIRLGIKLPDLLRPDRLGDRAITVDGVTMLTTEWMRHAKIPISSFYLCQRKGLSKEDTVRKYLSKKALKETA